MRRRSLLHPGAALLLTACTASATPRPTAKASGRPVLLESPPELDGAKTWSNSSPLTIEELRGQPLLIVGGSSPDEWARVLDELAAES